MPQILVADEQGIYRTGLCHLLRAGLPRADVLGANDLNVALSQMRNRVFDLVLVGTGQSGIGTLDTLKTARKASPSTRFAIVSASDTRADILAALAAGFCGFISKHQSDAEILAAITDILSGRICVPATLARVGDGGALSSQFDREPLPTLSTEADVLKLTRRQREVLSLLALTEPRPISRRLPARM